MTYAINAPTLESAIVRQCAPTLAGLKPAGLFTFPGPYTCDDAADAAERECALQRREALLCVAERLNAELEPAGVELRVLAWRSCGALVYVYRPAALAAYLADPRAARRLRVLGYRPHDLEASLELLAERIAAAGGRTHAEAAPGQGRAHGRAHAEAIPEQDCAPGQGCGAQRRTRTASDAAAPRTLQPAGAPEPGAATPRTVQPEARVAAPRTSRLAGAPEARACPCAPDACQREFPHEVGFFLGYPYADVVGFIDNCGTNYLAAGLWKVYDDAEAALATFARYRRCTSALQAAYLRGGRLGELAAGAA